MLGLVIRSAFSMLAFAAICAFHGRDGKGGLFIFRPAFRLEGQIGIFAKMKWPD